MVLTSLKKRLRTAIRGHKLMKDKRDELMKRFIDLARENKVLRDKVEERIMNVYAGFTIANAVMSKEVLEESLMYPKQGVDIKLSYANIMSVNVPVLDFRYKSLDNSDIYPYGFANTSGELDGAINSLAEVFPIMLELAVMEKKTALLAEEIEKTRRRVNALEYIMIPQLQETIKYIRMKLDENERGNQTRLMKVKDMMLKAAITEKQAATEEAIREYAAR
jgi:V/A-type H+-transporting ATPase subunit D